MENLRPTVVPRHRCAAGKPSGAKDAAAASGGGGASSSSSDGSLRAGLLLEYKKDDKMLLGLVLEPDGKKNFWVLDQNGRRSSVRPQQAVFVLPGCGYGEKDLAAMEALQSGLDLSLLEIAHEIVADGGAPVSLTDMCALLFDGTSAKDLYTTYRLLSADRVYFKPASLKGAPGLAYEARPADAVAATKAQLAAEAAAAEELQAWVKVTT